MRSSFFAVAILLLGSSVWSAEEATSKPNTLTPKEIAEGWLLLFDGETTFGWTIDGPAKIEKGTLILGRDKPLRASVTTHFSNNHQIRAEYDWNGSEQPDLRISSVTAGMGKPPPGKEFVSIDATYRHTVRQVQSPIEINIPAGTRVRLRNLKLRPTDTAPLFNGKDLAGWKEFPGRKSKLSVTPEGWINIKDGPGDLQTEGQWADFVLRIDCISNGKHLNSGVFFRCRPNEYQNGYEAQIRNQFTAEPTQEYTIEEYDPQTNVLKEKKKIKSTAVDYGTGAIYRRQPARREVAKDGEWFTMTVVAQGRHLATWVNGFQVTDWTDNRPLKDNARNGCRLEKGPISLQGHDPTTDLSFRNIRIAELPAAEKK